MKCMMCGKKAEGCSWYEVIVCVKEHTSAGPPKTVNAKLLEILCGDCVNPTEEMLETFFSRAHETHAQQGVSLEEMGTRLDALLSAQGWEPDAELLKVRKELEETREDIKKSQVKLPF